MPANVSAPVKVPPFCSVCGSQIESLTNACPVAPGSSVYICDDCRPETASDDAEPARDHYIGITDMERLRRAALADLTP